MVLRPENLTLSALAPANERNTIPGRIAALAFQGSSVEYEVDIGGGTSLRVLARPQADLMRGTPVWIGIDTRRVAVFSGAEGSGRRIVFEWERIDPQFLARIWTHCGRRARWRNRR